MRSKIWLKRVSEQLNDPTVGDELRVWVHPKLTIGFALERLLEQGELEGLIDLDGNLKHDAYDKIDDYLKKADE